MRGMSMTTTRILVLCTGNSCRSQIAEGFFRHYGEESVEVFSAGLEPKGVNPRAVSVMKEVGIDISEQTSDHISKYIKDSFDFVITVCDNAAERCPVFPGQGTKLHWPFEDPADVSGSDEEIMSAFRQVRDRMDRKIRGWLADRCILA
ncbi:MAG TPA: arsenate reductase ArsC [candidate division Zixibacteria bacterium]|nr:arsenate reductase ArsC [candidate division Zixibacteria bacterium]